MTILYFFLLMAVLGACLGIFVNQTLTKKNTLRFLMVLPIGGRINPMGDVCTEGIDLILQKVNSQNKILKDYNVVVDIIDDECRSSVAVEKVIPELENWKAASTVGYNAQRYAASLPHSPGIELKSANTTYTAPILVGGICSAVCKSIGKFPQHYNLIEVANACLDPALDDKRKYPNFYRYFRTLYEYAKIRKALISHLGVKRIGLLSDTTGYQYNDVVFTISVLSQEKSDVEIAAEEFFQFDPTEALSRLKRQDIRIIFAMCFVNLCPAIACAAYKLNYYGSNVVWVFKSDVDLVSERINRPPGCNKAMTDKFAEGAVIMGVDHNSMTAQAEVSVLGLTGKLIEEHIRNSVPASVNTGAFGWRIMCFEIINTVVNIADRAEQILNVKNDTLADVIDDPLRLLEVYRNSAMTVEYQATWGKIKMDEDNSIARPLMVALQLQDLKRVVVLVEQDGKLTTFMKNNFIWRTSDGNAPKGIPTVTYETISIPAIGTNFSFGLSAIIILALSFSIYLSAKAKNFEMILVMLGCMMLVISNLLFPEVITINSKCAVITSLLVLGFATILGILSIKLGILFIFRSHIILLDPKKRNRALALGFLSWMLLNSALVIALVADDNGKPKEITLEEQESTEVLAENITINTYTKCSSENFILGYVIIGIQSAMAAFGIFCGLITQHQPTALLMSNFSKIKKSLYILFPMTAALLMVQLVVKIHLINFIVLNIFSLGTGLVLVALFVIPNVSYARPLTAMPVTPARSKRNIWRNRSTAGRSFNRPK